MESVKVSSFFRKSSFTFLLFSVLFSLSGKGQTSGEIQNTVYKNVVSAYQFLIEQEVILNKITLDVPELKPQVDKTRTAFNSSFGVASTNIKQYFTKFFGDKEFLAIEKQLIDKKENRLGKQAFTSETAKGSLEEINKKTKHTVNFSPLPTVLNFQYLDNPQKEFINGYTTVYETKTPENMGNAVWQVNIPISWIPSEGQHKFVREYGELKQSIDLLMELNPLEINDKVYKKSLNNLFSKEQFESMVPDNGRLILSKNFDFKGKKGGLLEVEILTQKADVKVKVRIAQYMFVKGSSMYVVQGSIATNQEDRNLDKDMNKFLPLFELVARSVVIK